MKSIQRVMSHRWRVPAEPFLVGTRDGVEIAGTRLGDASPERLARFAEALSPWFTVYAMDLRGHGDSGGVSSYGSDEIEDVDAVVRLTRERGHLRVATMGTSMSAIAVVRHAALAGGIDHVVAISSLARWGPNDDDGHAHRARAWRRVRSLTGTERGRRLVRAYGVRLPSEWEPTESPERFGDAEDGLSPALARRLARGIYETWELPWPE